MDENIKFHNSIEDTDECRASLRKTILKYMRTDLPPEAQAGIRDFVDLIIKVANKDFVCKQCQEKYRMSGAQGFIL